MATPSLVPTTSDNRRQRRSGSFYVALPPTEAIHLFTAEGERLWVPGWRPTIIGPLPQSEGLVFLTDADGAQAVWTVLVSDWTGGRVKYCRVIAPRSAGTVEVRVWPEGSGSRVEVSYDITILPGGGELPFLTDLGFTTMLESWSQMIADSLRSGSSIKLKQIAKQAQQDMTTR